MALPTFNGFSLNDLNFITERIVFKGFASREVIRAKINRREGIKLLSTDFGEKEITLEGRITTSGAAYLQTIVDNMKASFQVEEGDLVLEQNRTFKATVRSLAIPDEHYNQTTAPFEVTFLCSDPFALGSVQNAVTPVTSGVTVFSGSVSISGTYPARPVVVYTPGGAVGGNTLINSLVLTHIPTGEAITITGFGIGVLGSLGIGLGYQSAVTINFEDFTVLEGVALINSSGTFPKWDPGTNEFTVTVSGRFPGGNVAVNYQPRFI